MVRKNKNWYVNYIRNMQFELIGKISKQASRIIPYNGAKNQVG